MSRLRNAFAALVLSALVVFPAAAERTLSWEALGVRAELDARGKLHVTERHTMVFDGDWNGGERQFRVERGQELTVQELARVDEHGVAHPMAEGELAAVDEWKLDGKVLRWRSRNAADPPFANQRLVYDIHYTLDRVLIPGVAVDEFTLNHDFAFPQRPSALRNFDLVLTIAPEWRGPRNRVITAHVDNIAVGKGYVLRVPLQYTGKGTPSAIPRAEMVWRSVRPWLVGIPAILLLLLFFASEKQRRAAINVDHDPIDDDWLQRNVFVHAPEVAGMIFDGSVGPPEVAALLARMERDGKIRSTVVPGTGRKPDLELELLVSLTDLDGRESDLGHLLFGSANTIRASELREAHKSVGLDLPAVIRASIVRDAEQVAPSDPRVWRVALAVAFFVLGIASFVIGVSREIDDVLVLFVVLFGGVFAMLFGIGAAKRWRKRPGTFSAIRLMLPGAMLWLIAEGCHRLVAADGAGSSFSFFGTATVALFLGGYYTILLDLARERLSPRGVRVRMQLSRAEAWFRGELQKPSPHIRDEWMPWLIALNLDDRVARWWRSFGGTHRAPVTAGSTTSVFESDSNSFQPTSRSEAPEFSAGGGRFGGGGSTGGWSAAATALAVPISAPSTSSSSSSFSSDSGSSSSSDSSSSSSGGGGGGGW